MPALYASSYWPPISMGNSSIWGLWFLTKVTSIKDMMSWFPRNVSRNALHSHLMVSGLTLEGYRGNYRAHGSVPCHA